MVSRIISPMGRGAKQANRLASRKVSLEGTSVGLLFNGKRNGDILLAEIGNLLMERYGAKKVVTRRKPHFALPVPPDLVEEMAGQCDVVIAAIGD
jgi:hypothetical protein